MAQGANGVERWPGWYPKQVQPDFGGFPLGESPYGKAIPQTLALFKSLSEKLTILDLAGGDGAKYAIPLVKMGHRVIVTDVHTPALRRLVENISVLPEEKRGSIKSVWSDITKEQPLHSETVDAALTAGFLYLAPPDELKKMFRRMVNCVKKGGLVVVEFATNRDRRPHKDSEVSWVGDNEYNYSLAGGRELLRELFADYGDAHFPEVTVHIENPELYVHADVIIASGRKP